MEKLIFVGVGGAAGAIGRYLVSGWIMDRAGLFPWGTLAVNVGGSFLIGFLAVWFLDRGAAAGPNLRLMILTGFLGGFTTFSTFSFETLNLFQKGQPLAGLENIGLNVCLCLAGVFAGAALGKLI